jgi:uncharacterized protein
MPTDRYIPGVPCWVDTVHPDPAAAAAFYGELFDWECEETMPADAPGSYITGRIRGADVAAIGSIPPGAPNIAMWNTYVWVDSADATTAAAVAAGATVVTEPVDIFDAGRMAMLADPEGAVIGLWEPNRHRGATVVNEPGSLVFNDLHTRDVERAAAFYHAAFGWEVVDIGGSPMWALPGYGEFLDRLNPGTLAGFAESGAPAGFENVVASMALIAADDATTEPHWGVTFGVADTDASAKLAVELGGRLVSGPVDAPWVRFAVIADPQGAVFTASQYVPQSQE